MCIKLFFSAFLAFTALVNPIQKVFVVFSLQKQFSAEELKRIMNRATLLVLFFVMGEAILGYIFNLELYAFQIACGIVLFYNGFIGLQKGFFFSPDEYTRMEDIIAVPFAVPMIAGPATITAVVSMPAVYGRMITLTAICNYLPAG